MRQTYCHTFVGFNFYFSVYDVEKSERHAKRNRFSVEQNFHEWNQYREIVSVSHTFMAYILNAPNCQNIPDTFNKFFKSVIVIRPIAMTSSVDFHINQTETTFRISFDHNFYGFFFLCMNKIYIKIKSELYASDSQIKKQECYSSIMLYLFFRTLMNISIVFYTPYDPL